MRFDFATADRIIFGPGTLGESAPLLAGLGTRAFVVTGSNPKRAERLIAGLGEHKVKAFVFPVSGEPSIEIVEAGIRDAVQNKCDCVVALGGGSAIDGGKAIAALAPNPGNIFDYLEVIGKAQPIQRAPLPFIAIPTTAGTGAEVTRNAVLFSPEHRVKASLRSPLMLPRLAIVDPELTYELPPAITASTGMDALTQLIEPFVSVRANPITDAICREGIPRAARSLRGAFTNGKDAAARFDMSLASLFGGMALANAGLGAVHGFAAPIGGMYDAPHGAVCATLLPEVMYANLRALQARMPNSPALERYDEVGRMLTGMPNGSTEDGIQWVRQLRDDLAIARLSRYGITEKDLGAICEKASAASSMKANPIQLSSDELMSILKNCL